MEELLKAYKEKGYFSQQMSKGSEKNVCSCLFGN